MLCPQTVGTTYLENVDFFLIVFSSYGRVLPKLCKKRLVPFKWPLQHLYLEMRLLLQSSWKQKNGFLQTKWCACAVSEETSMSAGSSRTVHLLIPTALSGSSHGYLLHSGCWEEPLSAAGGDQEICLAIRTVGGREAFYLAYLILNVWWTDDLCLETVPNLFLNKFVLILYGESCVVSILL